MSSRRPPNSSQHSDSRTVVLLNWQWEVNSIKRLAVGIPLNTLNAAASANRLLLALAFFVLVLAVEPIDLDLDELWSVGQDEIGKDLVRVRREGLFEPAILASEAVRHLHFKHRVARDEPRRTEHRCKIDGGCIALAVLHEEDGNYPGLAIADRRPGEPVRTLGLG